MNYYNTSLLSQMYTKININMASVMHNAIATDPSSLGSIDDSGERRTITQNDIICGMSVCGSDDEPTWQFCSR